MESLSAHATSSEWTRPMRPILFGGLAALALLIFYISIITLAQSWEHAIEQLTTDWGFVSVIMAGFGTQVGLYTFLRGLHSHTVAGGVVASTGTSTVAMLACCAHHLTEVFAIFGLSGATIFLINYKMPLLWLGIVMNLFGILYLLRKIRQQEHLLHMKEGM
jgi:hypothetical protein